MNSIGSFPPGLSWRWRRPRWRYAADMGAIARLLHAAVALVLIGWLLSVYIERRQGLRELKQAVAQAEQAQQRLEAETRRTQVLIEGLRRDDPLVVEWVARERLHALGPGEIPLPPAEEALPR